MAVTLNASTSSGFIATSDTSGSLELQANGTTKATVGSTGLSIGQYNPSASLITSGTAVASTSGTSIDFTSIPSWVKRITVMLSAVGTNGTSVIQVQIGAGSVTSSGYTSAIGAFSSVNSTGMNTVTTSGFPLHLNKASGNLVYATCVLFNMGSNLWSSSSQGYLSGTINMELGQGIVTLGGTLDRVRITTTNGTDAFNAGTINILYE